MSKSRKTAKHFSADSRSEYVSDSEHTTRLDTTGISRTQKLHSFLYSKPKGYDIKLVKSGTVFEVYEYDQPVFYNFRPASNGAIIDEEMMDEKIEVNDIRKQEYSERNAYRSRKQIIRLANTNFGIGDKFLTLTYDDDQDFDITSISICNPTLDLYLRKLRRKMKKEGKELKYLRRTEFQDTNDRGAVHFHLLCNLPYIHWSTLKEMWGHGDINIKKINFATQLGPYLAKYLTKNQVDERYRNHRIFSSSKNLKYPEIKIGPLVRDIVNKIKTSGAVLESSGEYESEMYGKVKYTRYNLSKSAAQESKL